MEKLIGLGLGILVLVFLFIMEKIIKNRIENRKKF